MPLVPTTGFPTRTRRKRSFGRLGRGHALALLLSGLFASTPWAASAEATFDYLYIVANEGGSSGGHAALRFDRDVYHFQNEDGLLVLQRDRAQEFLFDYALLGNRTIHATRVGVSVETLKELDDRFATRYRAQEAQIRVGIELGRDLSLLEALDRFHRDTSARRSTSHADVALEIEGLGFFVAPEASTRPPAARGRVFTRSEALQTLHDSIRETHGADFVSHRRAALREAMHQLAREDPTAWAILEPESAYAFPAFTRSYASRWKDLLASRAALDVLTQARPLEPSAVHAPTGEAFALDEAEVVALERYRARLLAELLEVVASRRADWGSTLLIGMARLETLSRSLEDGRLVFLDAYPNDAEAFDGREIHGRPEIGRRKLEEDRRQLARSRLYFSRASDPGELAWERVEERANRALEIERALAGDAPLRLARGHLVPSRSAPHPIPGSLARMIRADPKTIRHARRRATAHQRSLNRFHRYRLIDQNCVTAIFETINETFDDSIELSEAALGGHVGSRGSLAFIPFVSARQVNDRYRVLSTQTIPSYRSLRIREMQNDESDFRVALRESNTFTSTAYERSPSDSFFVFFTDDRPLLRPLLGAINLTAAIGQTTFGILAAPIDRGSNFLRGVRGAFVSFVELGFANIRKGTNEWIPIEYRRLDPIVEPRLSDR